MGDVDKLAGQLKHVVLDSGEAVVNAWVAGVAIGKTSNATKVGGTLVLTDRRLIFEPVKLPVSLAPREFSVWIDGSFFDLELAEVRDVNVDAHRRSALVVDGPDGSMTLNIAASRWSTMFSKKNIAARDEALAAISGSISGLGGMK